MSAKLDKLMQDWKFQKEIEEKASAIRKETEIEIYKEMMSSQRPYSPFGSLSSPSILRTLSFSIAN